MNRINLNLFLLFVTFSIASWGQDNDKGVKKRESANSPKREEKRLALVIGNNNYLDPNAVLKNAVNDAKDISDSLKKLGFDVMLYTDLAEKDFKKTTDKFTDSLKYYTTGLFYYSGHGLQLENENYLVPTDVGVNVASLSYDCVNMGRMIARMVGSKAKSLIFLDACRDNPFPHEISADNTEAKGLAVPIRSLQNSRVIFATGAGKTAGDNANGRNGTFTEEFLKHIGTPDLSLSQILERTKLGLGGKQSPSDFNNLVGEDFYFKKIDKTQEENQKKFENLLEEGSQSADLNDREKAKLSFSLAKAMATENEAINAADLLKNSTYYIQKADIFFRYEEYLIAKGWYLVAQSLNNTEELKDKVTSCDEMQLLTSQRLNQESSVKVSDAISLDEFESLKEQGTNLFQKGIYQKARLKYLAASEVPGHSADPFVKNRANSCETAMDLINKADTLFTKNNFIEVIATYSTVLFINTNDPIVKKKLSKIYFEMGERKLETDNFGGALIDYENANRYSPSEITERKIVICHNGISKVELAKRRSLKDFIPEISTGIVGIGAGVFALQLNNTWNSKVNQLNSTLAINDISTYRDQYAEAVKYQKKINLRNTMIGIGLAAVAAEGVFLILKRREFRHLRIEAENLSSVKLTYHLK